MVTWVLYQIKFSQSEQMKRFSFFFLRAFSENECKAIYMRGLVWDFISVQM